MTQSMEQIARAAYDAINRNDLDAFIALIDPEVRFGSLIAEADSKAYSGHEGVREWWREVVGLLEGWHFEMQEIHDFGERGYTELIVTGTVEGVGVPQRMFQAFRLREGKPYWWQSFRTEAEARDSLGLDAEAQSG